MSKEKLITLSRLSAFKDQIVSFISKHTTDKDIHVTKEDKDRWNGNNEVLGTTDISTIGGGTVTGAVNALNTNLSNLNDSFFYDQTYNDGNVRVIVNLFGKLCQIYVMLKAPVSNYTLNLKVINPKLAARYTVFITPRAYVIGYITDSILIISGDNHITEQNIGQGSFVFLVR